MSFLTSHPLPLEYQKSCSTKSKQFVPIMFDLQKAGNQSLHYILQKSSAITFVVSKKISPTLGEHTIWSVVLHRIQASNYLLQTHSVSGSAGDCLVPSPSLSSREIRSGPRFWQHKAELSEIEGLRDRDPAAMPVAASPHWEVCLPSFFPFFHPPP